MAPKFIRSILIISSLLTILAAVPLSPAYADGGSLPATSFPTLDTFSGWMSNGQAAQLRGVYVPDVLADTVVQQPEGQGTFVSPRQNIVTQFAAARAAGSVGLLAHNFLAGAKFFSLKMGQPVYLVYGDGHTSMFTVKHILQYKALQPDSPYSQFIDLGSGRSMSAGAVFNAVYARQGAVVFQTCIAANNNSSWGRLFIIADPSSAKDQ